MKKVFSIIAPNPESLRSTYWLFVFISVLLAYNFSANDIWTPNESFYAESVREMFESGNFLDIKYNYEPRYNKPPLTYWLIAASSAIFGLNEFGIRLPILLLAIGSVWVTYLLGKHLYGQKAGFYSMVVMAFSLQFLAVKQYASPEIPLTFFFTLTIYWFIKGFDSRSWKYIIAAYVILGLTVLTKGFPYIFVIGGIVGLYTLLRNGKDLKSLWKDIVFLKLPIGLLIVSGIGLSWIIFMYIKDGDAFWSVYSHETFGRAFNRPNRGLQLTFYLEVLSWSVLPYTLVFIYSIAYWVKHRNQPNRNLFLWCWLIVMLIIFTIAQGKIPTYMIQAHSAIAVIIASVLIQPKTKKIWLNISLYFPSILFLVGCAWMVIDFELHWAYWFAPLLLLAITLLASLKKLPLEASSMLPFWSMACLLFLLNSFLPHTEEVRPYDIIGAKVLEQGLKNDTPLLLDAWQIHNMPFYAKRKTLRDQSPELINKWNIENSETIALLPTENLGSLNFKYERLWTGMIYNFSSESQFFKFMMASKEALQGNTEKFKEYTLVINR